MNLATRAGSAALVGLMLCGPLPALAQDDAEVFGPEHRRALYEAQKKSVGTALLYTAALPPLGNFYVEQYGWGAVNGMLLVFALTFVGYAAVTEQDEFFVWGGVTAATSYLLAGVTSTFGVGAYNEDLRAALKVSLATRAPGLSISFTF